MRKMRVALFVGGPSHEHDISLISGRAVLEHLDEDKYEVIPVVISKSGKWPFPEDELNKMTDIVFIAMHGEYGEDGTLQGKLRDMDVPYTGSDVVASALAMNKILSSRLLSAHGINIPKFQVLHRNDGDKFNLEIQFPLVVKPADRGSSVGIDVVRTVSGLEDALQGAFVSGYDVIIQEYISGVEVTCAVLDDGAGDVVPLPPTEIIPKMGGIFDYSAKYIHGMSDQITPARFADDVIWHIQKTASVAHQVIGASGLSRTDMSIGEDGELYVFEINTIPAMAETALFPQAANAHGLTHTELFDRIIEAGLRRHGFVLG